MTARGQGVVSRLLSRVDLVMPAASKVWHIVAPEVGLSLCGIALPTDGAKRERLVDARVVSQRGKPVCDRCRRRIA